MVRWKKRHSRFRIIFSLGDTMKKAVVFDNSGTLIERFRVIKDVINGNIFTDINSLDLIDQADALALVVLQFNTNKLLKLDSDTLISHVIKEYDIDFDISFSTNPVSKAEVKEILDNEKSTTISDITDRRNVEIPWH